MPRDLHAARLFVEPAAPDPALSPAERAAALSARYEGAAAQDVLAAAIEREFPSGRIAMVSSFGAESAALLALVADIDRATPVLFVETQLLFPETLAYQREIAERLDLTDVRVIRPWEGDLAEQDPDAALNQRDPDGCCRIRKVLPLERALKPFDAWVTGRKRGQSQARAGMALFETDAAGRIKVNPLADWSVGRVRAEMARRGLPPHPLVNRGFPSIGCLPCTTPVDVGEDPRAGRWRGKTKDECGIHIVDGKPVRSGPTHAGPLDA